MKIKSLIRAGLSALVIVLAGMGIVGVGRARAASYVVSNLNDSGSGSLRQAVIDANASAGVPDTITFSVTGTITLTGGEISITDSLTITGPGAGALTISGNNASRVFYVWPGITASISGLTITGGYTATFGGGIYNTGTLTVTSSTISGNMAFSLGGGNGGGIYNLGTLTVTNSTVSGNTAWASGGIYNEGTLTVTSSTISGNAAILGGGIANWLGTLTVTNSTISGNMASFGGGIYNGGALNMSGALLTGNTATDLNYGGGALWSSRSITVSGNCFVGNTSAAGFDVEAFGGATTITATGNWWGSASGPGLTNPQDSAGGTPPFPGAVVSVPFLTSQPACGAGQGGGSAGAEELCTDGRLNCRFGDDYAILYHAQDEHGHPSLHAYCVDAAGNGVLSMVVTPHDLEGIPATPAANTQVKSADPAACRTAVSFWVLTTGEYQVNIGPDYKGDLIRMIFDGLPPQGIYFKKCNVLASPGLCGQ